MKVAEMAFGEVLHKKIKTDSEVVPESRLHL